MVLSIFPGGGLLDHAFELEGFCVVRGPDVLWGGDCRSFHPPPRVFSGVIGGPPCPIHSRLRHQIEASGNQPSEDLVVEFERVALEAQPDWWLMENAPACREPRVIGYRTHAQVFDNHWLGERQGRKRLIAFGTRDERKLEIERIHGPLPKREHAVTSDARPVPVAVGGSGKRKPGVSLPPRSIADRCELQGLPRDWFDRQPWRRADVAKILGNGVPIPMGRALARAVRKAMA